MGLRFHAAGTKVLAVVVLALCLGVVSQAGVALGVTENIDGTADELQQRVEQTAAAYDDAAAKVASLQEQITSTQAQINDIEAQLPAQREKASNAIRSLYKFQQNGYSLLTMLLSADDFNDFLTTLQYLDVIQNKNLNDAVRLADMENELKSAQAALEQQKAEAETEQKSASEALLAAQTAREEAQRRAEEQVAAEAAQAQAAVEAAKAAAAATAAATTTADPAAATSNATQPTTTTNSDSSSSSSTSTGDVNWSTSKEAFVSEWTARIDAYLAGSPLSGQGRNFAVAAWNYSVDPRWSPAISDIESGKGTYCFHPYNAWGWGSVSWSSWSEAIDAHVAGLARGYGYTLTYAAAQKYCPPTAGQWYSDVLAQMNSI